MPVVKVFIEKKSTAPNSAKVSIATRDNPATIAGRAAGNIILKNDLNLEKPRFFPRSIRFWDWYRNDALESMKTYAKRENVIDKVAPNIPLTFGIILLYSPSPNIFVKIVKAVP